MAFSSYAFLWVFLPLTFTAWWALRLRQRRPAVLLIASLVFYGWGDLKALPLLAACVFVNYQAAVQLEGRPSDRARRRLLFMVLLFDFGVLAFFKLGSAVAPGADPLQTGGVSAFAAGALQWFGAMPLGLSFYTFTLASYVTDVYRRTVTASRNPLAFAAYATAFPTVVSGPIMRFGADGRQFSQPLSWDSDGAWRGVVLLVSGMAKKVLIADILVRDVDRLFAAADERQLVGAWLAALLFTVQLYFDFSGYTDMAMGIGHLFGFRVPPNFDSPYRAANISEFWRRWHMSLSQWLRDYVFVAFGGPSVRVSRTVFAVMATMVVCGAWHGTGWTFLAWGAYHGAMSSVHGVLRTRGFRVRSRRLAVATTFVSVMAGWVVFRSSSLSDAASMLQAMAGLRGLEPAASAARLLGPAHAAVLVVACALLAYTKETWRYTFRSSAWAAVALAAVLFMCSTRFASSAQFLYFQF